MEYDPDYGGQGADHLYWVVLAEELSRCCPTKTSGSAWPSCLPRWSCCSRTTTPARRRIWTARTSPGRPRWPS
ncbi:MAG TPA: acyl-CoA dehydrogenase family protein [Acidimicrobiales bacterium]